MAAPLFEMREDEDTESPEARLLLAAGLGNYDELERLLLEGVTPSAADPRGATALHHAADHGHTRCIELLLRHKADIMATNRRGNNALHWATFEGHLGAARLLLDAKVPVDVQGDNSNTPLNCAAMRSHIEVMELLLEYHAHVAPQGASESTPLHWACYEQQLRAVEFLLEHKADPDAQDLHQRTPLTSAISVAQPSLEIIRLLLEGRASLAMPFRLAAEDFRPGLQNAILDSEGGSSSVLDLAVQANSAPIVELLLSYGADRAQVSLPIEDEAVAIALATFEFQWSIPMHRFAPEAMKPVVFMVMAIWTLEKDSLLAAMPREMVYEILGQLTGY